MERSFKRYPGWSPLARYLEAEKWASFRIVHLNVGNWHNVKKNFKGNKYWRKINIFMTQSLEKLRTVFCFFGASFCSCAFLLSSSTLTRISFSFKALILAWYINLTKSFTIFSGMSGNKLRMKLGVNSRILLPSFTLAPSL